ncbi:MAG: hypothetical protein GXO88_11800 [Chlorobi bacterium]|nr:hypothetical protein [Chlorobiota bacterium]
MTKKYLVLLSAILLLSSMTYAQFVTPLSSISGPAEVIKLDGSTIKGKIKYASFGPNGMMSFMLLDEQGNKNKFKASDIEQLKLKVDGLAKIEIIAEQSSNIKKLANSNFSEVVEREYIYWKRVKHPTKDKYLLLQLLNPGFDDKIQVYDMPNARSGETSSGNIGISGNEATAYYVVKDGNTLIIRKKKYKKQDFGVLFNDCPKITENNKADFKYFAEHVFFYNELCK